jgi:hypothetical protein
VGCSWQDWRENSNECFEKCKKCDYVKCPNAFFNETTMACECREFGGCTTDYVPVCGLVQVQCITTPCNPVYQTFGNRCELDRAKATFVYEGECSLNETTNKCDLIGLRKDEKFCSADKFWEDQIKDKGKCGNNFECSSNVCVSSQCVSEGFLQKILNWFKRLFD